MKPETRIAFVRQKYRPDGGAERFISRIINALSGRDLSLTVIAREWEDTGNYNFVKCNPFYIGRLWRDMAFSKCVCKHVAETEYDIVQVHEKIPCGNVFRAGDGVHREWLRQRSKILGTLQRMFLKVSPYHRYILRAEKRLYEGGTLKAVICLSKMVKEEILTYYNISSDIVHVVYNGIDTDLFNPVAKKSRVEIRNKLDIEDDHHLFLFVGSGYERKGLAATLKALSFLPSSANLAVVGYDKHINRYRTLAAKLGVADRVHFLGKKKEVIPYYGAGDALVIPAIYDPFPNVIWEAMACGLPVVTSPKCGGAEVVNHGKNGFVCDALDNQKIAEHMLAIMDDKDGIYGKNARESIEPYSLDKMGDQLVNLYKTIIS